MSFLELALSLGGNLTRSVDCGTGEVVFPAEHEPQAVRSVDEDGGGSAPASAGLSTVHISAQQAQDIAQVTFYSGSSYLKVSLKQEKKEKKDKTLTDDCENEVSKRGFVSHFSRKSRKRMIQELSKIRRDTLPTLITLTYPGEYSENPRDWKTHLDNFLHRFKRKFPDTAGVWKLEPQKRGAPHYHILVWGLEDALNLSHSRMSIPEGQGINLPVSPGLNREYFVPLLIQGWVSKAWYEVVGSDDTRHLRAGTRVEVVRTLNGSRFYASKYLGKEVPDDWGNVGRFWGIFNRDKLPYGDFVSQEVTQETAFEFIRYMRRFAHIRSRAYKSLTISCNADFWVNRLL